MITAQADKTLSRIMIICDDFELAQLILMIDKNLCVLRKIRQGEDSIILDILEYLRYKMRYVLIINREENRADTSDGLKQKKNSVKNTIELPIVEAFFYARILQRIAELKATQEFEADQDNGSVDQLVAAIDNELDQVLGDPEYTKLINGRQEDITFLYIQYLNQLYESRSQGMENEKRIVLLLELYKPIVMSDTSDNQFSFCRYSAFKHYCDVWMKENAMEDVCLEELLAEEAFRQRMRWSSSSGISGAV